MEYHYVFQMISHVARTLIVSTSIVINNDVLL